MQFELRSAIKHNTKVIIVSRSLRNSLRQTNHKVSDHLQTRQVNISGRRHGKATTPTATLDRRDDTRAVTSTRILTDGQVDGLDSTPARDKEDLWLSE
jgi:hypothetical protein